MPTTRSVASTSRTTVRRPPTARLWPLPSAQRSEIKHVTTPDVRIEPPVWRKDEAGLSTDLQVTADAAFPNYAIVVWGVPREFDPSTWGIETTAKSHLLARNSKDENHLVLWFNLQQSQTIQVRLVRECC